MSTIETWNKISNTGVKHKVRYKNETFMENSQVFYIPILEVPHKFVISLDISSTAQLLGMKPSL